MGEWNEERWYVSKEMGIVFFVVGYIVFVSWLVLS